MVRSCFSQFRLNRSSLICALLLGVFLCASSYLHAEPAPGGDIEMRVVDATSGAPVREFRVIAGVRAGSVASTPDVVNWQPHTLRVGHDGSFVWPAARSYDDMALRVEAE